MPWTLKSRTTIAEFDVKDEAPMRTRLGLDQWMLPYLARIEYTGGEFREITIFGWRLSTRTKKPTKQWVFVNYDLEELTRELDPKLPPLPPEWVKKLVASATFGGKV